mmetsp:Transcript_8239/g.10139  ORF Transcript_8239/g.10139 Transcript_8239/m.10139 type:complete len:222 (+) Transcript_8239:70-735(+)|eukprot:CAMPEP_0172513516 /NCGR_PEP_ID=MMETSP1066-20121228/253171_1 /TAXON_ID=671091 /ORGANISM="Coscinodiscus wailesii, Strain CCMP2513" /LENGTH=221 /DNA_ID=CAMNT_0013293827 /DNA_START=47 /DNA_END=712 /DNA_ORIENTATION=+
MKLLLPLSIITAASAFTTQIGNVRQLTRLNAKVDSSKAIEEALAASKKYGAASQEARVAWDIVEEMDAADNSASFKGGVSDEECLTDGSSMDCEEYENKLSSLAALLEENKAKIEQVKSLASEIQAVKLVQPSASTGEDSSALRAALAEAKEAAEKNGADSTEAKLAWETVEEIAASGTGEASQADLYDECLVEALEACEALDELARVMYLEKNKTGRYGG